MKNYEERKWNHICWRVDSRGKNDLFLNGEIIKSFYNKLVVIPSNDKSKSAFLIGQEPDSLRGDFNPMQAFRGRVANLNLWSAALAEDEILQLAECRAGSRLAGGPI